MSFKRSLTILCGVLFSAAAITAAADTPADQNDAKAREVYAKLISIPTQEGNGKVPELVEYLVGEFRAAGFPAEDIHALPFQGNAMYGGKGDLTSSLVVRYRGNGKGGKPIVVMAHMDVVTAKREDWERDPYRLVEENGYFYGRGTYDDKQGVAALTATFLRLKSEKFVPSRDLIIYFSGDEETAQASTRDAVEKHRALIDAEYALNADAGGGELDDETGKALYFSLQTAEKTYADFSVTAHNAGGHSSLPRADNAIYDLAAALQRLAKYRFPVMTNDTTMASFAATAKSTPGELGKMMARFAANPRDEAAAEFLANDPANIGKTRTTCVATMLSGGHAENALPQSASANVNCRIFPGTKIEDVRATLQKVMEPGVEVKLKGEPMSSDASPLRKDVMDAVTRAVHKIRPGVPVVPQQTSGATDGLVFRAAGIPTYGVDGNFMRPKDEFSHGLNERLSVQSFYDSLDYWHALLTDLAGKRR